MGRTEVDVINTFTRADIKMKTDEEIVDMCEAIRDMIAEGRAEGRAEERACYADSLVEIAGNIMNKFGVTAREAVETMNITEEMRDFILQRLS